MKRLLLCSWFMLMSLPITFAQAPTVGSSRSLCIKARDGKVAELRAFLMGPTAKLARHRVEKGVYSGFAIAEAVAPAGRSARCDFHLVYRNSGAPAETMAVTDDEMKKAGIAMTVAERNAKRDELSYLVATEYWAVREFIGTPTKGGYARLNYFKIKSGEQAEWLRMERGGWKQLAETWAKEAPGNGWVLQTLGMPGGTSLPYNALTVDLYPSWESMFKARNPRDTWIKVHTERDYSAYMSRLSEIAERPMVATFHLIEVISK